MFQLLKLLGVLTVFLCLFYVLYRTDFAAQSELCTLTQSELLLCFYSGLWWICPAPTYIAALSFPFCMPSLSILPELLLIK